MLVKRQGLIVWFHQMKHVKHIKKFGHMVHVSKKLKYAMLYVDQNKVDDTYQSLIKLPFITKVEPSYKPFIKTDYENKVFEKEEKEKEYDYKMGI
ncbi:YlbG family protein [Gracilibacillus sp. D59]|uniref:YlbG family protein n=1 Tax=Gracilibacillus sp. D59 TaxID=3457434 RepID=UPI003FCCBE03